VTKREKEKQNKGMYKAGSTSSCIITKATEPVQYCLTRAIRLSYQVVSCWEEYLHKKCNGAVMAKLKELLALLAIFSNLFLVDSFSLGLPHVNPGKTTQTSFVTW